MLETKDIEASLELSQFAFQFKKTKQELGEIRERWEQEPSVRWGVFVDGELAAQLAVLTLHSYVGGQRYAMGGVAGVATWPEYRRQGFVSELLRTALLHMKEQGQSISFLHPFAVGFYRKFGWELYTDNKKYKMEAALLPRRESYPGKVERHNDNSALLNEIYDAYARQYNGMLERTEFWWKHRIKARKPGQAAVYFDAQGTPQGYTIYDVMNKTLSVHEIVPLTEEARRALWSFLGQHDSMIDRAEAVVPVDDTLAFTLPNPRIKQEIEPYFMARIVDAAAFLAQYSFTALEDANKERSIVIELEDAHAPWNAGSYSLDLLADGSARVNRCDSEELRNNEGQLRIQTDIGSLTAMLLGYVRPLELLKQGRISGDELSVRLFETAIPVKTPFLLDFF
nr:GNAT family N-acetyltransferase [Paenibacillus sp. NEAU-GSW1]